jgi:hypothetical protein
LSLIDTACLRSRGSGSTPLPAQDQDSGRPRYECGGQTLRPPTLKPWLLAVDGRTSVGELASLHRNGALDEAATSDAQAIFRSLYLVDIIELSTRTAVA